jgi:hypothetical protein
MVIIW